MYNYIVHNVKNNTEHTVLPDAPIVIVRAAAWFIINLFIILLVQIANKMGWQNNF
jgi:hypothetical protein